MRPSILIIEDEEAQRKMLAEFLEEKDYFVETAATGEDGLKILEEKTIDVILLDEKLPGISGLEVLRKIKEKYPHILVLMITAYGTVEHAVSAMKMGAYDYLTKPIHFEALLYSLERAGEKLSLVREIEVLREKLKEKFRVENIRYVSGKMEEVMSLVVRVSESDATVLITGESGTGKELIASAIHYNSKRAYKPFIKVNLSALPETLIEAELFGHEKGAFTGAERRRIGRFEAAKGGTIFLDEIGDLPPGTQVKLLRVLQEREIERLGSNIPIKVDVRIIAATNQNIESLVESGNFREDLYYRLNVIRIHIPPLRERREDIPLLAEHFIKHFSERENKEIKGLTKEALDLLMRYDYPGNVRELENIIERAVILTRDQYITTKDLPFSVLSSDIKVEKPGVSLSLPERLESVEKQIILDALEKNQWIQTKAAQELGISERVLRYRMEKLNIKKNQK